MDGGFRPLLLVLFSLVGRLVDFQPGALRAFGFALHALNGLLVWIVAQRLFRLSRPWATAAAFLFLLHPIQTTSLALVWKQSDLWIAFFLLVSLLVLLRSKPVFALALFVLSLGFKESALILPAIWLALEPLVEAPGRRGRLIAAGIGGLVGAGFYFLVYPTWPAPWMNDPNPASPLQNLFTQIGILGDYALTLVAPSLLTIDRMIPLAAPPGALATGLLAGTIGLEVLWRVPTSSFVPLALVYDETRLYLAVAAIGMAAATVLSGIFYRSALDVKVRTALLAGIAFVHVGASLNQTGRFQSEESLWNAALEVEPYSARAYYQLGVAAQEHRELDAAVDHYRAALEFSPSMPNARLNLGIVLGQLGKLSEAEQEFHRLFAAAPHWAALGHYHLGLASMYRDDSADARRQFASSLDKAPGRGLGWRGEALLLLREGKKTEALAAWNRFVRSPGVPADERRRIPPDLAPLVAGGAPR
jgi:tetratricopeptide (TPR) repeat protein